MNELTNGSTLVCAKCGQDKSWRKFRVVPSPPTVQHFTFSDDCRQCEDPLDHDLYEMERDQLIAEAKKLRATLRAVPKTSKSRRVKSSSH